MESKRLNYIDNIRWITIVLVVIYHIIYSFNNSGVISNIGVKGIPIMDTFLVFVYPWFMCLLFVISGISIRYSLKKRTNKEFIKDRIKRILLPSILGIFIYGWITGLITNQYVDMFGGTGNTIPGFIKYVIYCLTGMGPLWYCHVLFIGSLLIVLIKKIDKNNNIGKVCKKVNLPILFLLVILVWESSYILNVPVISVYRFGIYLLMMLLGYYIFSNEEIIKKIQKISEPLIIISAYLGFLYVYTYYGTNYADNRVLTSIFTNIYLWVLIICILGVGSKCLDFKNKFTEYMTKNNFNIYVIHYPIVLLISYLVVTYMKLPFVLNYILILVITLIVLPILVEIIKRIPVIRFMAFGISKSKNSINDK